MNMKVVGLKIGARKCAVKIFLLVTPTLTCSRARSRTFVVPACP